MRNDAARIRRPVEGELLLLQEIERRAGAPFAEIGLEEIAEDDPPSLDELREALAADQLWVSVDEEDAPWAYLFAIEVDGLPHVEQVSVDPRGARRGLGRQLIEFVAESARRKGASAMTLTTFRDVPWNAPYYERLGFRTLDEAELGPELIALRREEIERGLDRWPRVAMRRELPSSSGVDS
ncbi:MAG: GNAT family N-acetyltransferase [Acidobacteriota bacterium]